MTYQLTLRRLTSRRLALLVALGVLDVVVAFGPTRKGRQAIQNYFFLTTFGEGTHGLKPGGLHTQMVLRPLINVAADGQSAKGRWWEFPMTGQYGVKAEWAAGIFENEYVRERGVLEDLPHALQPDVRRPRCDRLASTSTTLPQHIDGTRRVQFAERASLIAG